MSEEGEEDVEEKETASVSRIPMTRPRGYKASSSLSSSFEDDSSVVEVPQDPETEIKEVEEAAPERPMPMKRYRGYVTPSSASSTSSFSSEEVEIIQNPAGVQDEPEAILALLDLFPSDKPKSL